MDREQELWALANMLINRHGAGARFHAAQRTDELSALSGIEGHAIIGAILSRIEKLTGPAAGKLN